MKPLPYTYLAKGEYWRFRHPSIGERPMRGNPFDHTFVWHYRQLLSEAGLTRYNKKANDILRRNRSEDGHYQVYFIGIDPDGPIKIGIANDVAKRLRDLQTASPEKLTLHGSFEGGPAAEKSLHQLLSAFRMRGEWFKRSPEVVAEMLSRLGRT